MSTGARRTILAGAAVVAAIVLGIGGYLAMPAISATITGFLDDRRSEDVQVSDLDCVDQGYPCSMHDVEPQVWARTQTLLMEADQLREEGATGAEIVALLQNQSDVVDVAATPAAITFRVDGDQPVHLWTDLAGRITDDVEEEHLAAGPPTPAVTLASYEPAGTPGAGNDDPGKRAIIIEPFGSLSSIWSGADLAATLRDTSQYASADHVGRDTLDFDVMLALDAYDVVHISGHGWQDGVIGQPARQYYDVEPDGSATLKDGVTIPDGVTRGTSGGVPVLAYPTDFFRSNYPTGVSDAIFVADWCRSARDSALASAIAGPDTTYLGWSETVGMGFAGRSSGRLWELLADDGLAPSLALTQLEDEGLDGYTEAAGLRQRIENSFGCLGGSCPTSVGHEVGWVRRGVERRARDVVTSLDRQGARIGAGTVLSWRGDLADRQRDHLDEITVLVEGVEHGRQGDVRIDLFLDGEEFPETLTLDEAVELPVGPRWSAWELTVEDVELPFDVTEDRLRPAPLPWEVRVHAGEGHAAHVVTPVHLERPGIELKHPEHLARLDDGDVVEVEGYRNDGEPDDVDIVFDVVGIDPEDIDEYEVVVTVDGGTMQGPQERRYRVSDMNRLDERHYRLRDAWRLDEDLSTDNDDLTIDAVLMRRDERFEHDATIRLDADELTGCSFRITWSGSYESTTERFDGGGGSSESPLSGGGDIEFREETEWVSVGGSDRQHGAMALVPPVRLGAEDVEYGLHMNAMSGWGSPPAQGPDYLWTLSLGGVVPPGETGVFEVPYRSERPRSGMELIIDGYRGGPEGASFAGPVEVDLEVNDTVTTTVLGESLYTRALKGEFRARWSDPGRDLLIEGAFQYRPEDCSPDLP